MSMDVQAAFPDYEGNVLDAILIDPKVREIITDAINENRRDGGLTIDDARALCHQYDERWRESGLMEQQARIYGHGRYLLPATESEPAVLLRQQLEGIYAESFGFTILSTVDTDTQNLTDNEEWRLALVFKEVYDTGTDTAVTHPVAVPLDEIESLEFDGSMSLLQAESLLDFYLPELKALIDAALDTTMTEMDALYALGNIVYDMSSLSDVADRALKAIDVYINFNLQFDSLPYAVHELRCTARQIMDDGSLVPIELELDRSTLLAVNGVFFIPEAIDQDSQDIITAHMDCTFMDEQKFSQGHRIIVPMYVIERLESLRETFYTKTDWMRVR